MDPLATKFLQTQTGSRQHRCVRNIRRKARPVSNPKCASTVGVKRPSCWFRLENKKQF
ncbi:unnamed protein product [Ectocarpus sp. 12 AP-2014]